MRFAILFLAALHLPAQEIKQTGPYTWTRVEFGSRPVNPSADLYVHSSGGRVEVRGTTGDRIEYTLTRSVRAVDVAAAREILGRTGILAVPSLSLTRVQSYGTYQGTLEIKIPRQTGLVHVDSEFGPITVIDFDGRVEMKAIRGGTLSADGIRGSVTASTTAGAIQLGNIGGGVECYTGADSITINHSGGAVNCRTEGGEIRVADAAGAVRLVSGGGNIYVGHAGGLVEAHADQGSIQVVQAGGLVIADNAQGGSIQVGSSMGVRALSAGGTVRVNGDMGPINVQTTMGNILAELAAGAALSQSLLSAASGDITVRIPSNLRITIMATSSAGGRPRIFSDFNEVQSQAQGFWRSPGLVQGAINGGGAVLKIDDPRGVIQLVRVK